MNDSPCASGIDRPEREGRPFDIAIVGMACMYAGAGDLHTYWKNILNKTNSLREIPAGRWKWEHYYDPSNKGRDAVNSRWGGFIEDALFDPLQYGIPPNCLPHIEPMQLLLLMCTRAALEDSGYLDRGFDRSSTSVIIGAGGDSELAQKYSFRAALPSFFGNTLEGVLPELTEGVPEWKEDSMTGLLTNVAAGRVANRFDLGGSTYAVDAACASSLAALRAGCLELLSRNSSMVIVAGADTIMSPYAYTAFSKATVLSPTGKSRPFDAQADGIVLSEGVGTVVIKRLEDARRDGDRVYAVIKGLSSSSDGRGKGLTAPREEGIALALKRTYEQAAMTPDTVGLIEAHATGTQVGDQTECRALIALLTESSAEPRSCAVGSVKSMIGHPKRAAGIAGLIKAALALHHKVLPPTMDVEHPIADLASPESPLYLNTELSPWIRRNGFPRRAGVSSFGFGGTNFHALLEECDSPAAGHEPTSVLRDWPAEVLFLRGNSRSDLVKRTEDLVSLLHRNPSTPLRRLACHFATGPDNMGDSVLSVVCHSMSDLKRKLGVAMDALTDRQHRRIWKSEGIYYTEEPLAGEGRVAFLYPGQGSQYCGMLASLAVQFPVVRQAFERFDDVLRQRLQGPLSRYVYPPHAIGPEETRRQEQDLMQTRIAQAAMGAADLAMHKLLESLGLKPDLVAGHSYGEYVALHVAGVLDERSLAELSEARGSIMAETAAACPGGMIAARTGEAGARAALQGHADLWVSNVNSPDQTVISGSEEAIARAQEILRSAGIQGVRIPTACAFHTPMVAGAQTGLERLLETVPLGKPALPAYSNTTACPFPEEAEGVRRLLVRHIAEPVNFVGEIEAMYEAGARIFVEAGAGNVLSGLVGKILKGRAHRTVHTDRKGESALVRLQHVVAQLGAEGIAVNLEPLYRGRDCQGLQAEGPGSAESDTGRSPVTWVVQGGRAFPLPLSGTGPSCEEQPDRPARAPIPTRTGQGKEGSRTAKGADGKKSGGASIGKPMTAAENCSEDATNAPRRPAQASRSRANSEALRPSPFPGETMKNRPRPQEATGGDEPVMAAFQQSMQRFLDTQRTVMLAYLEGQDSCSVPFDDVQPPRAAGKVAVPESHRPVESPAAETPVETAETGSARAPVAAESVKPPKASTELKSRVDSGQIETLVLQIVEERTGYPGEVLELDLDLEADLGLDSIKKVEIFGALREKIEQLIGHPLEIDQEEASRVTTLGGIIDLLRSQMQDSVEAQQPASPGTAAPQGEPTLDQQHLTEMVLALVEERTGYPRDVLDPDLDLEADLGLDSIKKVEIFGALREKIEAETGRPLKIDQEEASRVGTLREIIELISGASTSSHPEQEEVSPGATTGPAKNELTETILSLVETRTGYPKEVLDLDLDLEADLGLDSIKKVEIFGALREKIEEATGKPLPIDQEQAARVATLRGIIDLVAEQSAGNPARPAPQTTGRSEEPEGTGNSTAGSTSWETEGADGPEIKRFIFSAVECPLTTAQRPDHAGRAVLVTHLPRDPVADAVLSGLEELKIPAVSLCHSESGTSGQDTRFLADLASQEAVECSVEAIRQTHGSLGGLIHLLPLAEPEPFESMTVSGWKARLNLEVKSLFYISKALCDDLEGSEEHVAGRIVAATRMGGTFATDSSTCPGTGFFPGNGGVQGFMKTLAAEWPRVHARCVDLDFGETSKTLGDMVLAEYTAAAEEVEVGYCGGKRFTVDVEETALDRRTVNLSGIDASSVLLITGGARGITSTVALEFAKAYQPSIVLVGRSPEPDPVESEETRQIEDGKQLKAFLLKKLMRNRKNTKPIEAERAFKKIMAQREMRANIKAMRDYGARVTYCQADAQDADALGGVVRGIYEEHGRIDGVIHGAGIIEDKRIREKDSRSFDRVFDTKADSLFLLTRFLKPEALRFFALFSSAAGAFGNPGQCDYGAVNRVYDKVAVHLDRQWSARVVSFIWGPWESEGMVSQELRKAFRERGITVIPRSVGPKLLMQELFHGSKGCVEVGFGNIEIPTTREGPPEDPASLRLLSMATSSR